MLPRFIRVNGHVYRLAKDDPKPTGLIDWHPGDEKKLQKLYEDQMKPEQRDLDPIDDKQLQKELESTLESAPKTKGKKPDADDLNRNHPNYIKVGNSVYRLVG